MIPLERGVNSSIAAYATLWSGARRPRKLKSIRRQQSFGDATQQKIVRTHNSLNHGC
jgi:hypothetical protein